MSCPQWHYPSHGQPICVSRHAGRAAVGEPLEWRPRGPGWTSWTSRRLVRDYRAFWVRARVLSTKNSFAYGYASHKPDEGEDEQVKLQFSFFLACFDVSPVLTPFGEPSTAEVQVADHLIGRSGRVRRKRLEHLQGLVGTAHGVTVASRRGQ